MYFPPSKINPPVRSLKKSFTLKMIERAVDRIKMQYEWGYISSSYLFFKSKKVKTIIEEGKAVEILLYGRSIKELNTKEAIFILNGNNYDLSLEDFYKKFNNLKNRKLLDVFKEAINCPKVDESVKKAFNKYINN